MYMKVGLPVVYVYDYNNKRAKIADHSENVGYTFPYKQQT